MERSCRIVSLLDDTHQSNYIQVNEVSLLVLHDCDLKLSGLFEVICSGSKSMCLGNSMSLSSNLVVGFKIPSLSLSEVSGPRLTCFGGVDVSRLFSNSTLF